ARAGARPRPDRARRARFRGGPDRRGARRLRSARRLMEIRPFRAGGEGRLGEVARASKAHWGYDADVVGAWAVALDYSGRDVHVAEADGAIAGYATLAVEGERAELDELWVEPASMGRGVGELLFRFAAARAAACGADRLEW